MTEIDFEVLTELHINNQRQGPGSLFYTLEALRISGFDTQSTLEIADIGAGTGAASIALLNHTQSHITAVDLLPAFVDKLNANVLACEVNNGTLIKDRLTTLVANMDNLPFKAHQFDLIWSEGAIYNIGFETGINLWKPFLKPKGLMVISELTWLTDHRSKTIEDFWQAHYPEISTADKKISQLAKAGYQLRGYFPLPVTCWLDEYYAPLLAQSKILQQNSVKYDDKKSEILKKHVDFIVDEVNLFNNYQNYYSYGMYIVQND